MLVARCSKDLIFRSFFLVFIGKEFTVFSIKFECQSICIEFLLRKKNPFFFPIKNFYGRKNSSKSLLFQYKESIILKIKDISEVRKRKFSQEWNPVIKIIRKLF